MEPCSFGVQSPLALSASESEEQGMGVALTDGELLLLLYWCGRDWKR